MIPAAIELQGSMFKFRLVSLAPETLWTDIRCTGATDVCLFVCVCVCVCVCRYVCVFSIDDSAIFNVNSFTDWVGLILVLKYN